jgi:hypothetical protein
MFSNQYLVTEAPIQVPSQVRGGAYVSKYTDNEHILIEKLQAKVKQLKTNNQRLREELQKTQQILAETCAHVNSLQRKIAAA